MASCIVVDATPRLTLLGHRAGKTGFIHVNQVKKVGVTGNGRFELPGQKAFDIKVARGSTHPAYSVLGDTSIQAIAQKSKAVLVWHTYLGEKQTNKSSSSSSSSSSMTSSSSSSSSSSSHPPHPPRRANGLLEHDEDYSLYIIVFANVTNKLVIAIELIEVIGILVCTWMHLFHAISRYWHFGINSCSNYCMI